MTTRSDTSASPTGDDVVAFGPFELNRTRCELLKDGVPIPLGSRATGILLELTQSAGEIVSNRELLRRVWKSTVVEDGTLRVQVALLRKTLRDADPHNEYLQNVTGRGYRFIMPVAPRGRSIAPKSVETSSGSVLKLPFRLPPRRNNVPRRLGSIVGRDQIIRGIADKVVSQRFVTVTGPGGSGKTTVAIAVADVLVKEHLEGVCFVDLAAISEARFVANALASAVGVDPLAADPLPDVLASLSQQSLLLILDSCEHMIEATAKLAERVLRSAPRVHVLATSREPLRATGESVHDLAPLEVLPEHAPYTRARLLKCPAIRLFVERASAYVDTEFNDEDLRRIADVCRRLGGNPLAIEITASHVRLLGINTLATSLDDELYLSIHGRRTAEPRHQSLRATFDWSHGLLSPAEQATFRRLSVFAGCFDLECAAAVVADDHTTEIAVFESLMSLARKSLVCADTRSEVVSYRMLDLPRAYAREKLVEAGEQEIIRHRHALMWCSVGALQIQAHVRQGSAEWMSVFGPRIDDLRAATRWSFSASSGSSLSAKLKLTTLWFEFVLAAESSGAPAWVELYGNIVRGSEGALLSGLEDVLESSRRWSESPMQGLTVLQQIDSESEHKTALWSLWFERVIKRDYRIAINLSNAARAHPRTTAHQASLKDRLLAVAHHYAGEQQLACQHAQWALQAEETAAANSSQEALLRCHTRSILARSLWVHGFPDQALETAMLAVEEAQRAGIPRLHCMTLLVAIAVSLWCGDTAVARHCLDRMHEQAQAHALEYYQLWANCLRMIVAAPASMQAIEPLQLWEDPLSGSQYLDILGSLREELVSTDAIVRAEAGRTGWCTSELLRVKAERLIQRGDAGALKCAHAILHRSLETARLQAAQSWELRTAMSLARLWRGQGRTPQASELLKAVYSRFTEGFDTADLKAARHLLQQLDADLENRRLGS